MKPARIVTVCMAAMLVAGGAALAGEPAQTGDPAKEILKLTGGARTKIVWSRGNGGSHQTTTANSRRGNYSIMILDTSEGRERVLATQSPCRTPFITPSGNRVIVDDGWELADNKRIYVMDMNGNKTELGPAHCAMGVAEDPCPPEKFRPRCATTTYAARCFGPGCAP